MCKTVLIKKNTRKQIFNQVWTISQHLLLSLSSHNKIPDVWNMFWLIIKLTITDSLSFTILNLNHY